MPRTSYDVSISPDPGVAEREVRVGVTTNGEYPSVRIERIDFGDGTPYRSCSYSPGSGYSEDCEVYTSSDRSTQYCYHVYKRPGRYTIRVSGNPDRGVFAYGELTIDVVQSSIPLSTPTFGTPRGC